MAGNPLIRSIKGNSGYFFKGLVNSYGQIFFSDKLLTGIMIMVITFFDIYAGICGAIGVVTGNVVALWLGYNRHRIAEGIYGYNILLVCLGIGISFAPSWQLFLLILLVSVLTLFITIFTEGILNKYGLPFLSIPFLIVIWTILLASREFSSLGISERGIYSLNEMYGIGGMTLVKMFSWWNGLEIMGSLKVYFISLGAIFFQYNTLAGIIIAIALFIYSRIAFSLSLLGFYTAYIFYGIIGANITELGYSYIGFNYILTSIAIGGFFLVPTKASYLWSIILVPIGAIFTLSLNYALAVFQLPVYSLPFNIVVLMFIYVLKLRPKISENLVLVSFQRNSPEKNLYAQQNSRMRYKGTKPFAMGLPFWGEWTISQGHDGKITHKEEWKYAFDFVIEDEARKTYAADGNNLEDYYCYNKAVLAPADGVIEEVIDSVQDNEIGDVNLSENWGNVIIIKHSDFLFTCLAHLKKDSFKVAKGEHVKKGQVLASVGNSGRSPEPHLHLQFQATPFIGSVTLNFPFGYYVKRNGAGYTFNSFALPKEGDVVSNIQPDSLIKKAVHFIPGQKLRYCIEGKEGNQIITMEVFTDAYNNSCIHSREENATAWFYNDGSFHAFTHFDGNRKSLLYNFYRALYKVQPGFYKGIEVKDEFPSNISFKGAALFIQDIFAPFYIYLKSGYRIICTSADDDLSPSVLKLESVAEKYVFGKRYKDTKYSITITEKGIQEIEISEKDIIHKAILVS